MAKSFLSTRREERGVGGGSGGVHKTVYSDKGTAHLPTQQREEWEESGICLIGKARFVQTHLCYDFLIALY